MNIGHAVRTVRTSRAMSQKELAELSGHTDSYISLLETSKRTPTLNTLIDLCEALDINIIYLIFLSMDFDEQIELPDGLREPLGYHSVMRLGL